MAVAHIGPMKLVLPVAYIAPMGLSASRPACFKGLFIGSSLTLVFLLSFPTPTNIIARFVKLCGLMPGKLLVRWRDWNHYPSLDFEYSFCPLGCCRMAEQDVGALQGIRTKANFLLAVTGKLESELKSIIDGLSYNEGEIASEMKSTDLQHDERVPRMILKRTLMTFLKTVLKLKLLKTSLN